MAEFGEEGRVKPNSSHFQNIFTDIGQKIVLPPPLPAGIDAPTPLRNHRSATVHHHIGGSRGCEEGVLPLSPFFHFRAVFDKIMPNDRLASLLWGWRPPPPPGNPRSAIASHDEIVP